MNSVGLNVFIAIVGISAGPGFVAGIKANGHSPNIHKLGHRNLFLVGP
jgi:uncharacterized transporter YbjL